MGRASILTLLLCLLCSIGRAQHSFRGVSLSDALVELDHSSTRYDISFVYDELEDFTVSKTIIKGSSLPDAVRAVCGFYPVRVKVQGREIFVECLQKARTKLSGRLVDEKREPVPYANVVLYSTADTSIVGGGVSNEAGDFVIPCAVERVVAKISCVGFKTIERSMTVGSVGTIRMQMADNYLSHVTVSGHLPIVRSDAGRLQYLVVNDEYVKGMNVEELLSRVPMVTMQDRQALILGKGPARFMLNGRIMDRDGEVMLQKLRTLRSEDVERIEVVTIPTGRRQTETGSGYINIVLRRDQTLGWQGDVSWAAGLGVDWNGRAEGQLNYASEKLDLSADISGERESSALEDMTTYHIPDGLTILAKNRTETWNTSAGLNTMLRYMPVKNVEIGTLLTYRLFWPKKEVRGRNFLNGWSDSLSVALQRPINHSQTLDLTAYCDWKIDGKGKLLSLTYNYYKKDDDNNYELEGENANSMENYFEVGGKVDYNIQSARLDLTLPFRSVTWDAGLSYTNISNKANLEYDDYLIRRGTRLSERLANYKEASSVAYASVRKDWRRISATASLRLDYTTLEGTDVGYDVDFKGNSPALNLLPSLGLTFTPAERLRVGASAGMGRQLSLCWGREVLRPNFYDLNPFRIYKTMNEYFEGNPALLPNYMNKVELSYHDNQGLYANAYHHHCSNEAVWQSVLSTADSQGDLKYWDVRKIPSEYVISIMPDDGARSDKTGLYLRCRRPLLPMLTVTAEGEAYYYDFLKDGDDLSLETRLHGWGKRVAAAADWFLDRRRTLLLNARYNHWFSDYMGATRYSGYGYFHLALRYSLLHERLKLSLVLTDPFLLYVTDSESFTGSYNLGTHSTLEELHHIKHHTLSVALTATYSFGGKKVRRVYRNTRNTDSKRAEKQPAF